jgi:hypothetical protein
VRNKFALEIADSLGVITDNQLGEIFAPRFNWTPGHSARVQARKILENLTNLGKITKHEGFYRSLSCRSEFSDHARALSETLVKFYNLKDIVPTIRREVSFPVGLRADAVIFLKKEVMGRVCVYECDLTEDINFLKSKENEWNSWGGALQALSDLFPYGVDCFDFVTLSGRVGIKLTDYLEEL